MKHRQAVRIAHQKRKIVVLHRLSNNGSRPPFFLCRMPKFFVLTSYSRPSNIPAIVHSN